MEKIWFFCVLFMFSTVFISVHFVQAAPAQWGIAFNHDTMECAGYWEGDEFFTYTLPHGWKDYYICDLYNTYNYSNFTGLKFDLEKTIGSFNYTEEEFCAMWPSEFCTLTGYSYVSDNIGNRPLEIIIPIGILILLLVSTGLIYILKYKKK